MCVRGWGGRGWVGCWGGLGLAHQQVLGGAHSGWGLQVVGGLAVV